MSPRVTVRRHVHPGSVLAIAVALASLSGSTRAETSLMTIHAEGVQIYECKPAASGGLTWQFREPLAILLKDGKTIGRHFVGPNWELTDGERVTGKIVQQTPAARASDIPWLTLTVTDHAGQGALSRATTIKRMNPSGGAFAGGCDRAGALHLEPYAADYAFLADRD